MKYCLYCNIELKKRIESDGRFERPSMFSRRKFCNVVCRGKHKTESKTIIKKCPSCLSKFSTTLSENNKTCSRSCMARHKTRHEIERKCLTCKQNFYAKPWHVKNSAMKFCSTKCYSESLKGPLSVLWKGGRKVALATSNHKRRTSKLNGNGFHSSSEWLELKRKYNFSCLCCGKSEPEIKLTRDHVVPLISGGSNSITNIQPLCSSCNSKKHKKTVDYRVSYS